MPYSSGVRTSTSRAPSVAAGKSLAYQSVRSPFSTLLATNPAMFTGSFADPKGGA